MNTEKQASEATLNALLKETTLEELPEMLRRQERLLITGPRPFADYMRRKFREKGIRQQDIFLAADISENYGYKLISEEKHTSQRDMILRICLAARFDREETQEALILYGIAPLYIRIPRDMVFLAEIHNRLFDIYRVNELLSACGLPLLFQERT